MIENPEIAQSYVLMNVLRDERDRLILKLSSISELQKCLHSTQTQIVNKQSQKRKESEDRKETVTQLEKEEERLKELKAKIKAKASAAMSELRKSLNLMKEFRKEVTSIHKIEDLLEKEDSDLSKSLLNIGISLENAREDYLELQMRRESLKSETEIGLKRMKEAELLFCLAKEKHSDILAFSLRLQKDMEKAADLSALLKNESEFVESQINEIKLKNLEMEENRETLQIRVQKLKDDMKRKEDPNIEDQLRKEEEMEEKFARKHEVCSKISGQNVMLTAQIASLEREMKFKEHKKECVSLLLSKLYSCRDKFISHRRTSLLSSRSFGRLSREEKEVSISMSKIENREKLGESSLTEENR